MPQRSDPAAFHKSEQRQSRGEHGAAEHRECHPYGKGCLKRCNENQRREDRPQYQHGQPGWSICGTFVRKSFAALWAGFIQFQIAGKELSFPAGGTAALKAAQNGFGKPIEVHHAFLHAV